MHSTSSISAKDIALKPNHHRAAGGLIAGTLVHTDKGLLPIEQIQVGDRVLSQAEEGGPHAYKKVFNTFVDENKEIWVVKYKKLENESLRPGKDPEFMTLPPVYHEYCTSNQSFWVEGKGWTATENLRSEDVCILANGSPVMVRFKHRIFKTPQDGFGRVITNLWAEYQEAHIVDFRNGSNLWSYARQGRPQLSEVEYKCDYSSEEAKIIFSQDPYLHLNVYNLEIEDFHTYYVGELGIWVLDASSSVGKL